MQRGNMKEPNDHNDTKMISREQVLEFVKSKFNETEVESRIKDVGWAYEVNSQPKEAIESGDWKDTVPGLNPLIITKNKGEVYQTSSAPLIKTTTEEEFYQEVEKNSLSPIATMK